MPLFRHFFIGILASNRKAKNIFLLRGRLFVFSLLLPTLLTGCFGNKQNLIYETFKRGVENPNNAIEQAQLNPRFRYLKVDVNNLPALLVLGYDESSPNGVIDTWYSAYKEVIQIQNGRLVNTQGLELNWTDVSFVNAPSLTSIALVGPSVPSKKNMALRYERTRTVMPTYRANIVETVEMQVLENAPDDAPRMLKQENSADSIRWVQERVVMQTNVRTPYLDPVRAIYAVNTKTMQVIYGRQCLADQFCISWLQWPYTNTPTQQNSSK